MLYAGTKVHGSTARMDTAVPSNSLQPFRRFPSTLPAALRTGVRFDA